MDENVKHKCICELGCDKGALKKTIENNVFTIYGNITKNSYVILRYHGELIDNINHNNYQNDLYISYYFDDKPEKHILCLAKCSKCVGESYCALIALEDYSKISFEFFQLEQDKHIIGKNETSFSLNIENNTLNDFLKKYGLEENANLPVIEDKHEIQLKKIINNIKSFLLSLFRKADTL